jgi:hypothetical protein
MGEAALYEAIRKGAPLVEVTVRFVDGIDHDAATAQLNAIAEDFHLIPRPWYNLPQLRVGSATKEALERLFGWRLKRVPLPKYDEATKTWGYWQDVYMWEEVSPPERYPVDGMIQSIGMSQPGADDDGQWYE